MLLLLSLLTPGDDATLHLDTKTSSCCAGQGLHTSLHSIGRYNTMGLKEEWGPGQHVELPPAASPLHSSRDAARCVASLCQGRSWSEAKCAPAGQVGWRRRGEGGGFLAPDIWRPRWRGNVQSKGLLIGKRLGSLQAKLTGSSTHI